MQLLISFLLVLTFQSANLPRYLDLGNGTVVDTEEMFGWTQASSGPMNGEAADAYVRTIQTAGYADWHLPSGKELHELFDQQACHPLGSQPTATVCLTPAITLAGAAAWIRDADGLSVS